MKYVALRVALLSSLILMLSGCEYRLMAPYPPSRQLIRIDAQKPEQYKLEMKTGNIRTFDVPIDGRVSLEVPPYRQSCGPYLFGAIRVGGDGDPLKNWTVSITREGKTVRRLSLAHCCNSPRTVADIMC